MVFVKAMVSQGRFCRRKKSKKFLQKPIKERGSDGMVDTNNIGELCILTETQLFDRKSARIDPKTLANLIIAFANADGGDAIIGIEDDGTITGIDGQDKRINDLLRVPLDYCAPSVSVDSKVVSCTDAKGHPNHILIMHVFPSPQVHANQADEVYLRIGDKSKKLNFDQRLQLLYSKGTRFFEDTPVLNATIDDIDLDFVANYTKKIGYGRSAMDYLRSNKDFITMRNGTEQIISAAILLFGKNPQRFFPRARVRFIRYDGTEAKVGTEMNVIKDVLFDGKILDIVQKSTEFVKSQIREHTFLGKDGLFVTIPELPEFCWTELIVNAIAHRDYNITGTDIQIKMFDDHMTVESPGQLPGLVRSNNMREMHFSRNPKIVEFLHVYEYVKEFGEGVDRMYREMEDAGLPDPEYHVSSFMLYATLKNQKWVAMHQQTKQVTPHDTPQVTPQVNFSTERKILEFCSVPRSCTELLWHLKLSDRKNLRTKYLNPLISSGKLKMTIPDKPRSKQQKYVKA